MLQVYWELTLGTCLLGSVKGRVGQKEKLNCRAFSVDASANPWGALKLEDHSEPCWLGQRGRAFRITTSTLHWMWAALVRWQS